MYDSMGLQLRIPHLVYSFIHHLLSDTSFVVPMRYAAKSQWQTENWMLAIARVRKTYAETNILMEEDYIWSVRYSSHVCGWTYAVVSSFRFPYP